MTTPTTYGPSPSLALAADAAIARCSTDHSPEANAAKRAAVEAYRVAWVASEAQRRAAKAAKDEVTL